MMGETGCSWAAFSELRNNGPVSTPNGGRLWAPSGGFFTCIPCDGTAPVKQRSLFACFSHEGVFIDVHVSKTLFEPKDELLLSAIIGSVYVTDRKVEITSGSAPNSMELFREGSRLYVQRKFQGAILPYQEALDLEKKERWLQQDFWRVLVDNLGVAYGITGDLKRAKETFEYGVSQDNTFPMFYYNLACTYAEMNNIESTMSNLKTAFGYKENVIKGETMPDPRSDDPFQRFMNNEEFRKMVDSLVAPSKWSPLHLEGSVAPSHVARKAGGKRFGRPAPGRHTGHR